MKIIANVQTIDSPMPRRAFRIGDRRLDPVDPGKVIARGVAHTGGSKPEIDLVSKPNLKWSTGFGAGQVLNAEAVSQHLNLGTVWGALAMIQAGDVRNGLQVARDAIDEAFRALPVQTTSEATDRATAMIARRGPMPNDQGGRAVTPASLNEAARKFWAAAKVSNS